MNIDLSSGSLLNVAVLGIGVYLTIVLCFWQKGLSTLSHPGGYFAAVILGFVLMPYVRITDAPAYRHRTEAVVREFGRLLSADESIVNRIARPAYDLFLRELPNADRLIERVHSLGEQKRVFYSFSRLFFISSALLSCAGILRLVVRPRRLADRFAWFFPRARLGFAALLLCLVGTLGYLAVDFNRRGDSVLARERNLEMMAILVHRKIPRAWARAISKETDLVTRLFPEAAEVVPNTAVQP